MKKSLIYILALSTIVGCQKSEVPEQIPSEGESSAVIVGSLPETKTSFIDEGNVMKTEWVKDDALGFYWYKGCLLYTSPSPRDAHESRMPSSA